MKPIPKAQGLAVTSAALIVLAFIVLPASQVLLSLAVLLVLAGCVGAALLIHRHGLAELLYLGSAHLMALGDAVAVAQERHRLSLAEYRSEALAATRCIQEAL